MQLIKFFNLSLCVILLFSFETVAQRKNKSQKNKVGYDQSLYSSLKFREIGPRRGGVGSGELIELDELAFDVLRL